MGKSNPIIIGGDHHNTLGVLRSLGEAGIKSDLIVVSYTHKISVQKSKYVDSCICISKPEEITAILLNKFTEDNKRTVICCSDVAASEVDLNYNSLSEYFHLPHSSHGQSYLTNVMNKGTMLDLAKKVGIPVPKSFPALQDVKLPCFIKPLISKVGSKQDITICRNDKDLDEFSKTYHISQEFQYQQFIDKEFEFQLIGCSLNYGDTIIIPGVSKVVRSSHTSNTGVISYLPLDSIKFEFLEECKSFIRNIGYEGLFSMEFIRDKKGNDYFMEINLRNDGNAICVFASGVNLPLIWHRYCQHLPWECLNVSIQRPTMTIPELDDFFLFLHRKITLKRWLIDLIKADCRMEFSTKDWKPFAYKIIYLLKSKVQHND